MSTVLTLAAAVPVVALAVALVAAVGAWTWVTVASARYEQLLASRYEQLPPSQRMGGRSRLALGRIRVAVLDNLPPSERPDPATVAADARAIDAYATPGTGRHVAELPPTQPMPVIGGAR